MCQVSDKSSIARAKYNTSKSNIKALWANRNTEEGKKYEYNDDIKLNIQQAKKFRNWWL